MYYDVLLECMIVCCCAFLCVGVVVYYDMLFSFVVLCVRLVGTIRFFLCCAVIKVYTCRVGTVCVHVCIRSVRVV